MLVVSGPPTLTPFFSSEVMEIPGDVWGLVLGTKKCMNGLAHIYVVALKDS